MMKLGSSTKINNVPQNLQPFRPSDMNFPCLNQLKMIVVRWESQIIYKTFCLLDNVPCVGRILGGKGSLKSRVQLRQNALYHQRRSPGVEIVFHSKKWNSGVKLFHSKNSTPKLKFSLKIFIYKKYSNFAENLYTPTFPRVVTVFKL